MLTILITNNVPADWYDGLIRFKEYKWKPSLYTLLLKTWKGGRSTVYSYVFVCAGMFKDYFVDIVKRFNILFLTI